MLKLFKIYNNFHRYQSSGRITKHQILEINWEFNRKFYLIIETIFGYVLNYFH